MSQNKKQQNSFDLALLWKVIQLSFPYKGLLISTVLITIALSLLGPTKPELIQRLVDNNILGNGNQTQLFVVLLIVSLILESIFRYLFIYNSNKLGQNVVKTLRMKVFKHVINLKLSYFDKTPIGTTTTRTVNDIETINQIFTQGFIQLFADILTLIIILVWMFLKSWKLALISITLLPFMFLSIYFFKENVKIAYHKVRNQVAYLNAFLQEHITGMKIVQIFGAEQQEYEKFEAINEKHKEANIDAIWAFSIFFPVVEILLASAIGLMVWLGAGLIINENLFTSLGQEAGPGLIIQFILLINLLFRPIRFMAERFNTLQMGLVAAQRVFQLIERDDTITNKGKIKDVEIKGNIKFENVSFAYLNNDYVLKDINFNLPTGKTLAIIGPTGSGKSSIINLINRLYEHQKGTIFIDDVDIKDYELSFYRKQISTVLQDVFLFSGTIMDNIKLLDPSISDDEVIAAAKLIGAHEFIANLPNAYQYDVMERGATLSLGQRQLISFIRALVHNPSILILDEATSSVDSETEYIVQQAIDKLIEKRTSIVIAHRLATIKNADYVMLLENGTIVDKGSMNELLNRSSAFQEFYSKRSKK